MNNNYSNELLELKMEWENKKEQSSLRVSKQLCSLIKEMECFCEEYRNLQRIGRKCELLNAKLLSESAEEEDE